MNGLRIVGILMILASGFFFWQFRIQMAAVEEAKREANGMSYFTSADTREVAQHDSIRAREDKHRSAARNWFLSGAGTVVVGAGLVVMGWLRKRKASSSQASGASG
jgi:hypothetical protein